jgi:hypothetical protein
MTEFVAQINQRLVLKKSSKNDLKYHNNMQHKNIINLIYPLKFR